MNTPNECHGYSASGSDSTPVGQVHQPLGKGQKPGTEMNLQNPETTSGIGYAHDLLQLLQRLILYFIFLAAAAGEDTPCQPHQQSTPELGFRGAEGDNGIERGS